MIRNQDLLVLNPHGSDETKEVRAMGEYLLVVLNPHGSDETCIITSFPTNLYGFLTHTVQMKLFL